MRHENILHLLFKNKKSLTICIIFTEVIALLKIRYQPEKQNAIIFRFA